MMRKQVQCTKAKYWEPQLYRCAEGCASAEEKAAVDAHLCECPHCRLEMENIRWMLAVVKESVPAPDRDISSAVLDTILANENGIKKEFPLYRRYTWRHAVRLASGAAAAVLLVFGVIRILPYLRQTDESSMGNAALRKMQALQSEAASADAAVTFRTMESSADAIAPDTVPELCDEIDGDDTETVSYDVFWNKATNYAADGTEFSGEEDVLLYQSTSAGAVEREAASEQDFWSARLVITVDTADAAHDMDAAYALVLRTVKILDTVPEPSGSGWMIPAALEEPLCAALTSGQFHYSLDYVDMPKEDAEMQPVSTETTDLQETGTDEKACTDAVWLYVIIETE